MSATARLGSSAASLFQFHSRFPCAALCPSSRAGISLRPRAHRASAAIAIRYRPGNGWLLPGRPAPPGSDSFLRIFPPGSGMTASAPAVNRGDGYCNNQEHLQEELRRIDLLIRAHTVRWRGTVGKYKPEQLWGMVHVTDAEIDAYLDS